MTISHPARRSVPKGILKELSKRQWFPWIRDSFMDWGIILTTFYVLSHFFNPILFILSIFIIGNRQHALALLGHDGTHYTITYKRKINDALTNFLTWLPLGITLQGYRNLHDYHHKHLGTENDPEVIYKMSKIEDWEMPTGLGKILKLAFLDILGFGFSNYKVIFTYSAPPQKSQYVPLFLMHSSFVVLTLSLGLWWIPVIWYMSLVTSFVMFFRLRLWLEHQGTDHAHRLHLNPIEGALLAPHLSWHHWEHHFWPSIPYYNLASLRKATPGEPVIGLKDLLKIYNKSQIVAPGADFSRTKSQPSAVS